MNTKAGHLVISLDFELFWGMSDATTLEAYGPHVAGERTAIPRMLSLFNEYGIHATWATVGMLMTRNKEELLSLLPSPEKRPVYKDMRISTYYHLEHEGVGSNENDDPYHYGPTLVEKILATPHQEIENHTFSHYYAVDGVMNAPEIFAADLDAHRAVCKTYGVTTSAIVFPRNQASPEALQVCKQKGLTSYRGNEDHFLYRARTTQQSLFVRALRLVDHYINISGHHTYSIPISSISEIPLNIPSSRFLRPWMKTLSFLEPLRMRRIKTAMTYAAKRGEVFHLWWHPHNFGINQTENFRNLLMILSHYKFLQEKYGMQSSSMKDLYNLTMSV